MEITSVGDSALIVRVRDRFEDAPKETLKEVLDVFRRLENARIPGVIELAPAYTTVAVFFDPVRVINATVEPAPKRSPMASINKASEPVHPQSKFRFVTNRSSLSILTALRTMRGYRQVRSFIFTAGLTIS